MFISHSNICLNYINAHLLNAEGKRESIIIRGVHEYSNIRSIIIIRTIKILFEFCCVNLLAVNAGNP